MSDAQTTKGRHWHRMAPGPSNNPGDARHACAAFGLRRRPRPPPPRWTFICLASNDRPSIPCVRTQSPALSPERLAADRQRRVRASPCRPSCRSKSMGWTYVLTSIIGRAAPGKCTEAFCARLNDLVVVRAERPHAIGDDNGFTSILALIEDFTDRAARIVVRAVAIPASREERDKSHNEQDPATHWHPMQTLALCTVHSESHTSQLGLAPPF
jgi:hypothetical protein